MNSSNEKIQNESPLFKKRKRSESQSSKETPRYQCYCDKIYLSYPALYLHLKNKHPECFLNNRKIEVTKFKESLSQGGIKILKIQRQPNSIKSVNNFQFNSALNRKNIQQFHIPNYVSHFPYQNPKNFMIPLMERQPYFPESQLHNNIPIQNMISQNVSQLLSQYPLLTHNLPKNNYQLIAQKEVCRNERCPEHLQNDPHFNLTGVVNFYISEVRERQQLNKKEVLDLEILLSFLLRCIKQHKLTLANQFIGSSLNSQQDPNLQCLKNILPFFRESYFPVTIEKYKQKPQINGLSRKQIFFFSMAKVNKYFIDPAESQKQVKKFEEWLEKIDDLRRFSNSTTTFI